MNNDKSTKSVSATTSLGLPISASAKGPALKVSSFKDVVSIGKKAYTDNGASANVAVVSMFDAVSLSLFFGQFRVPVEFHPQVKDALEDYCMHTGQADGTAQRWYEDFCDLQRVLHAEHDTKGASVRKGRKKGTGGAEGSAEDVEPPEPATAVGDSKGHVPLSLMIEAMSSTGRKASDTAATLEQFSPTALSTMAGIGKHINVSNELIKKALARIPDERGTIKSVLKQVDALSMEEKAAAAPRLFSVFGVSPDGYLVMRKLEIQASTNQLQNESEVDAHTDFATFVPASQESFTDVVSRLEDVRRKVATATGQTVDVAVPESQAVTKLVKALETSRGPALSKTGMGLRAEFAQRRRADPNFAATLQDVKFAGDSLYKVASSDMSTAVSGKSGGKGEGKGGKGSKRNKQRQDAGKQVVDELSDPNAVANLATVERGRGGITCHRCNKPGHYASDCTAPAPAPKQIGYPRNKSRSTSRERGEGGRRGKGGKGGKGGSADGGKQHSANVALLEIKLLKAQLEIEKLKSTQPASEVETPAPGVFN